jgi:hypothetical protein
MQPGCRAANAAGQASLSVVQAQLATQRRAKAPPCICAAEVALRLILFPLPYVTSELRPVAETAEQIVRSAVSKGIRKKKENRQLQRAVLLDNAARLLRPLAWHGVDANRCTCGLGKGDAGEGCSMLRAYGG